MTNKQKLECNAIIHTASISAGAIGAGLAQVPGSDNTFITPIQMGMAVLLAQVFGISLNSTVAKATWRQRCRSDDGKNCIPGAVRMDSGSRKCDQCRNCGYCNRSDRLGHRA